MKSLVIAVLFLASSVSADAICTFPTEQSAESTVSQAKTVFVATITKAYLDPDFEKVSKGTDKSRLRAWYTIRYDFEVAMPIKGEPSSVPFLVTKGLYNDPNSKKFKSAAEQSRFVPGDNILVVTNGFGPVPISWTTGCTDSRPWDRQAFDLLRKVHLLPTSEQEEIDSEWEGL